MVPALSSCLLLGFHGVVGIKVPHGVSDHELRVSPPSDELAAICLCRVFISSSNACENVAARCCLSSELTEPAERAMKEADESLGINGFMINSHSTSEDIVALVQRQKPTTFFGASSVMGGNIAIRARNASVVVPDRNKMVKWSNCAAEAQLRPLAVLAKKRKKAPPAPDAAAAATAASLDNSKPQHSSNKLKRNVSTAHDQ